MAGTLCNFATQLKYIFRYDDTLDVSSFDSARFSFVHVSCADLCLARHRVVYLHKPLLPVSMALPRFLVDGWIITSRFNGRDEL